MDLTFRTAKVRRGDRSWNALIVTPARPIVLGRERLRQLRRPQNLGEVDNAIVCALASADDVSVLVFRSADDDGRCLWRFASDLTSSELHELACGMLRSQVKAFRRMVEAGVNAMVHVELGEVERDALAFAVADLLAELDSTLR